MLWMALSYQGVLDVYVHKSEQAVRQTTYLDECINKRLLRFIEEYHHDENYIFWRNLTSAHYSTAVQQRLEERNVPFVRREDNPPNVPRARPIKTIGTLLERKVYEHNRDA